MTITETWTPEYESWRHGGWYVTNVRYPGGAVGWAVVVEAPADAELYRTGVWWPCWAVDVPCTEEG